VQHKTRILSFELSQQVTTNWLVTLFAGRVTLLGEREGFSMP
jgi:hypothetical protein